MLTAAVLGQKWAVPHPEVWNALILAFVLTAAVGDIRWRKIPRLLTTAAVAAGLIFHLVHGGLGWEFASALIATLIAFGVGLSFFQLGAIGGGDVKLITALGALLGLDRWILAMEVAVLAAALIGIVQAVRRGMLGQMLRNIGSLLKWLVGRGGVAAHPTINVRNSAMLRAPFGVAAALGTLFAVFKP
ncbi:MAG TPA: A24 family peptidase [Terriglobales bacterium]|nr:A24 family peptidase [Terriglobales bacterium]